jgi:hypothetical protein
MAVIRLTPSLCTGVSRCWSIEHDSQRVREIIAELRSMPPLTPA